MTLATLHRGQAAEGLAAAYLQKKGWKILTRNFRTRAAELDLVALDGKMLVFVEVKQRTTRDVGLPEEAVGAQKIRKLYTAAQFFLKIHPQYAASDCRFDVVAVEGTGAQLQLRHHQDVACI